MKVKLQHIAFIMDGNGRFAEKLNQPRTFGHLEGAKRIPEIIEGCQTHQIPYISFFAFSTENWNRAPSEVAYLMKLLESYLTKKTLNWFQEHQVNLNVIGFDTKLKKTLLNKIKKFENEVNQNSYPTKVNIFFNYGSRAEIVNACNVALKTHQEITEENFNSFLLTKDLPDVDLLIRTSGEKRISNFMLWQIAYSEIIFEPTLWPEYTTSILDTNIVEYYHRDRRFGTLGEKK